MRPLLPALALGLTLVSAQPALAQTARIDTREVREWLTYLSSDELQGRQAYTEGLGLAAAYIADHLKAWGVKPGGDDGGYFQTVKVLGIQTKSSSSVTVEVKGQTRTFKDGEGVTFPRNMGTKGTVKGQLEFVGYGMVFAPLQMNDYAGHDVAGKVAIYVGRGGEGLTNDHNRLVNARGRTAIESYRAVAAIGPSPAVPPNQPTPPPNPQRIDFQTPQRLDAALPPQITAGEEFYEFIFDAAGQNYGELQAKAEKRETLPAITLPPITVTFNIDAEYSVIQTRITRNVVGIVEGTDARLRSSYVMLGAHYDHVGYQQFTGTNATTVAAIASCVGQTRPTPRPGDIINNGADDDGSGTVALMALAKSFAKGAKPKRSLMFVWHTAEEGGLSGSRYMADYPSVPLANVSAQLNIDMVGRNRCDDPKESDTVYLVGSDRISTELHNINEEANAAQSKPMTFNYELNDASDLESIYTRSDHYSYASKGVPIIFYTTGLHRDYHYVTDEVDKIDFGKLTRVAQTVYATAVRLGNLDHLPARDNKGPRVGKGQSGKID